MTQEEIHPIKDGFVLEKTKVLIVGTFPPKVEYTEKGKDFFFYSSVKNQFWNRIDNIFPDQNGLKKTKLRNKDESYETNKKRKENFCEEACLGFIDVFTRIKRNTEGSKDTDLILIENIVQNNYLETLLLKFENIKRICCTYSLAFKTLKSEIEKNKKYSFYEIKDDNTANGIKLFVTLGHRKFEIVLLYPATRSNHKKELKDSQYRNYLSLKIKL